MRYAFLNLTRKEIWEFFGSHVKLELIFVPCVLIWVIFLVAVLICKNLEELDLRDNQLNTIHPDAFEGLTKLENVKMNSNQMTRIESNGIKIFKNLEIIENKHYLEFRARIRRR